MISKAPSRLNPNTMKTSAMKPFTHGFEPSCTTPNGPAIAVTAKPRRAEEHDDAEAEDESLHQRVAPPAGLPVEEERDGDRDHREDAGRKDSSESEAEGDQQEMGETLDPAGRRWAWRRAGRPWLRVVLAWCSLRGSGRSLRARLGPL